MSGQSNEGNKYTLHVVIFLGLTVLMYAFAYLLVDHTRNVPERVDTVHSEKAED